MPHAFHPVLIAMRCERASHFFSKMLAFLHRLLEFKNFHGPVDNLRVLLSTLIGG